MARFDSLGTRHLLEDCERALAGVSLPPARRESVLSDLRSEMEAASGFIARASAGALLAASDIRPLRAATWLLELLPHVRPDEAGRRAAALADALGDVRSGRVPSCRAEAAAFLREMLEAVRWRELLGECAGRA